MSRTQDRDSHFSYSTLYGDGNKKKKKKWREKLNHTNFMRFWENKVYLSLIHTLLIKTIESGTG